MKKDTDRKARQILIIVSILILMAFSINNLIDTAENAPSAALTECDEYEVVSNGNTDEVIHVLTCGPERKLWVPGYTIRSKQ